jgi:hypothetical protein
LIELVHVKVRDADCTSVAARASGFHPDPGPGGPASGPVDEVEVDVVDLELLDAVGGLSDLDRWVRARPLAPESG